MGGRRNTDSERQAGATAQKRPWLAPKAEAQPVRTITAGTFTPLSDGTGGCHS